MSAAVEVCRAFRNSGSCKLGEDCKREHSAGEKIIPPKRDPRFPTQECPRNPNCSYGRFCPFYHSEEDKKREILDICQRFRRGQCSFGDKCNREHLAMDDQEKRPLDCIRWVKEGDCAAHGNGNCVYIHVDEKKGAGFPPGEEPKARRRTNRRRGAGAAAAAEGAAPAERAPRQPRQPRAAAASDSSVAPAADGAAPRKRKRGGRRNRRGGAGAEGAAAAAAPDNASPAADNAEGGRRRRSRGRRAAGEEGGAPRDDTCFAFRDNGACDRGDDCSFRHGPSDVRDLSVRKQRKLNQICFKFKAGEDCPFADKCRYVHDHNAPDPTVSA